MPAVTVQETVNVYGIDAGCKSADVDHVWGSGTKKTRVRGIYSWLNGSIVVKLQKSPVQSVLGTLMKNVFNG